MGVVERGWPIGTGMLLDRKSSVLHSRGTGRDNKELYISN